ncbi:uncharacterized protein LOC110187959 [Drosophila serrata]|uniref:uncharacterized protein LOC110187959 n=1 Tax=Drosophila serrata TaxID=7274 RepID=UPI000A1D2CA1|nr:uncharacterized protein LOC110187959 [Drosophila serrata]
MNNPWREMGFIAKRRPKVHLKIVQIKKRLNKTTQKFKENREKLIELKLRNRIKKLVIEELENKVNQIELWRRGKQLKNRKSSKTIQ